MTRYSKADLERFKSLKSKIKSIIDNKYGNEEFVGPIQPKEPENNNGRSTCYWCGEPTKKINGFIKTYDYCMECKK